MEKIVLRGFMGIENWGRRSFTKPAHDHETYSNARGLNHSMFQIRLEERKEMVTYMGFSSSIYSTWPHFQRPKIQDCCRALPFISQSGKLVIGKGDCPGCLMENENLNELVGKEIEFGWILYQKRLPACYIGHVNINYGEDESNAIVRGWLQFLQLEGLW